VTGLAAFRQSFDARRRYLPFEAVPVLKDTGLVLGHGSLLVHMGRTRAGAPKLMLQRDETRLLALLGAAYGRQMSPRLMHRVARASEQWARGETALAQIELAFARWPRLRTSEDAFRLFLAEEVLAQGMSPHDLAAALGFDPALLKYDSDQPRQNAGHGKESGEWIKAGDADAAADSPSRPWKFLGAVGRRALGALTHYVRRLSGPMAIADAFLIPDETSGGVLEGELPGWEGVHYRVDRQARDLVITAKTDAGRELKVSAVRTGDLYLDENKNPLGRDLGSGLYLNQNAIFDALADRIDPENEDQPKSIGGRARDKDEPELCPAPSPDRGKKHDPTNLADNGDKEFADLYQEYIGSLVNPQIKPPLPATLAYTLWNPQRGKYVAFDHCQLTTGIMIEVKGHYENVLKFAAGRESVRAEFLAEADRQIQAADANGGRPIEWDFYEEATLEFARETFEGTDFLARIRLVHRDYPGNDEWPYPKKAQRSWARGRQKP
jgi:hypothetical protein